MRYGMKQAAWLAAAILGVTVIAAGVGLGGDAAGQAKGFPVSKMSEIAAGMTWLGKAVDDPDYFVWCTSPIMGPDKKVHLFCSRWPKRLKFDGWCRECEIAHYVGDRPAGPFRFADVAIAANPKAEFNNAVHNPAIARVGDTYVLLYITFDRSAGHAKDPPAGRMLTCMATSASLSGPWKLAGKNGMVFGPSEDPKHWTFDPWAMDNPTFVEFGGKYYIYFKAGPRGHQFDCKYGYAVADKPEGPYVVSDKPCTDNTSYIEDATAFVWNGKVCMMTTDNFGKLTGIEGAGILWKSDVPTSFKMTDAQIGFLHVPEYWKLNVRYDMSKAAKLYTSNDVIKFERPGVLMMDGKPAYFYAPCGTNFDGGDHTCSYVMKIELPK